VAAASAIGVSEDGDRVGFLRRGARLDRDGRHRRAVRDGGAAAIGVQRQARHLAVLQRAQSCALHFVLDRIQAGQGILECRVAGHHGAPLRIHEDGRTVDDQSHEQADEQSHHQLDE
jgi:hypothetical protein